MKPEAGSRALLVFTALLVSGCRTSEGLKTAPGIIAGKTQSTVYSGEPQPVKLRLTNSRAPAIVIYFDSREAMENNSAGTPEAPVDAGRYYVRVTRPAGNGYAAGGDMLIEYRIEKKPLTIIAEEKQSALYDGNPKRVTAAADSPVQLSAAYFPTPEARQAAENSTAERSAALKGLTRVERSPAEPGVYYVLVYYNGSRNYLPVSKEIEFTIRKTPTERQSN